MVSRKFLIAVLLASSAVGVDCASAQTVSTGRATTIAPTYLNATQNPLSLDLSGNLRTTTTLAPNSSVNLSQVNGVTTPTGNGTAATSLRVTLSTDGTGVVGLIAGSAIVGNFRIDQTTPGNTNGVVINSGNLSANQSVNVSQINGVTPLMGGGNTGTGSPRVTNSTDNPAIANWGQAATGAAAPTGATQAGVRSGANMVGLIQADTSVAINISTTTTTQLVALSGTTKIYVTSFDVIAGGTGNITFVYGTGASCGTGTTSLTGPYNLTAQAGIAKGSGLGPVLVVPSGNALCATTSANVQMSGSVSYTQF